MPEPSSDLVRELCCNRIGAFSASKDLPVDFENWLVRRVNENIHSGRFQRVASKRAKQHPLTLSAYIDQVILHGSREYAKIQALKRGDQDEWQRLCQSLFHRAYGMIRRLRNGMESEADAKDCAQNACFLIYHHRFPCDISFDAWANTILRNVVVGRYTRSSDVLDQPGVSRSFDELEFQQDDFVPLNESLADPQAGAAFETFENQELLRSAIKQLSSRSQRQVILGTYVEGLSNTQVAQKLGKSKQAVYNLRKRALEELRDVLADLARKKSREKAVKYNRRRRR